jgi:hypothetical protein
MPNSLYAASALREKVLMPHRFAGPYGVQVSEIARSDKSESATASVAGAEIDPRNLVGVKDAARFLIVASAGVKAAHVPWIPEPVA